MSEPITLCDAELHIGADGRWERATLQCGLRPGHEGNHGCGFRLSPEDVFGGAHNVHVVWQGDDRTKR